MTFYERPTILIVDDQPTNIQALLQILKGEYAVQAATSGDRAIAMIQASSPPDLILLDVEMSGMNGFETCSILKQDSATRHIPIIFVTAKNETVDEAEGLRLGAVDYLTKPVNPELVLARVRNHIELASYRHSLETEVEEKTHTIEELNVEIEQTLQDTLFTVGEIAEHRSMETGYHVKRVSEYAHQLAKLVDLSADECELLRLASSLHDIGKIAIPDAILQKPGRLSEQEYGIMKQHAEYGYQILKNSPRKIFKAAAVVAHTHHEKWNGSGYPRGLSGDSIPLFGRITGLVDVFDALGSDRCYKKGWEMEKVLDFIQEERGRHFDPSLVDHFLKNIESFLSIKEHYNDTRSPSCMH